VAERIVEESRPWRIDSLGNIQGTGHAQGGDTSGFSMTGNQSDGLVTHRSDRHQQECLNLFRQ
jgi:hypothetical protein